MKNLFKLSLLFLILNITAAHATEVKRYAVVIGKNYGGKERPTLKYAVSDALTISKVFEDFGGVSHANSYLLLDPSSNEIHRKLKDLNERLIEDRKNNRRNELIVYYSGHSDDEGLLIGNDKIDYLSLKKDVSNLKADVTVIILDSCASGSLTALKGGKKRAPFLASSMSKLKGHVFLTSSSSDEAAQESDRIKASFFTHYLVSGLRGAADKSGDGQVTINEAYKYAYNETLAKTSKTINGPQHPSYNMQLAGTGELILTDIRNTSAKVIFPEGLKGRLYLRDGEGTMIAEVNKENDRAISIGVMPGSYSVVLNNNEGVYNAQVNLSENKTTQVQKSDFISDQKEKTVSRGSRAHANYVNVPFDATLIPTVSTYPKEIETATEHNFSLSAIYNQFERLNGVSIAVGGTIVEEDAKGAQVSFGFNHVKGKGLLAQIAYGGNITEHDLNGAQLTVFHNHVRGKLRGAQIAAFSNYSAGEILGAQVSAFSNIGTHNVKGAQVTAFSNILLEDLTGIQLSAFSNYANSSSLGIQTTVFSNVVRNKMNGVQLSVFSNVATTDIKGAQLAVFNNYASGDVTGLQLGLVNSAKKVKGAQIGIVNYAEDVEGISIAPITIVKNGTYGLLLSQDDLQFRNISLKMGTRYTYSKLGFGKSTDQSDPFYKYSFAFGGSLALSQKLSLNPEVETSLIKDQGDFKFTTHNHLSMSHFRLNGVLHLLPHLNLFAGGSYNYVTDLESRFTSKFFDRRESSAPGWFGWQGGVELYF